MNLSRIDKELLQQIENKDLNNSKKMQMCFKKVEYKVTMGEDARVLGEIRRAEHNCNG